MIKLFIWRIKEKYVIRGLHPLIFFYLLSLVSIALSLLSLIRLLFLYVYTSTFPEVSFLILLFTLAVSINSALFAMWFDYQENIHLNPRTPYSTLRRYFKNQWNPSLRILYIRVKVSLTPIWSGQVPHLPSLLYLAFFWTF